MKSGFICKILFASSSLAVWSIPAYAQSQGSAGNQGAPQKAAQSGNEIIVVATRRDQALQDVPMAVTAIGQDALRLNQVNSVSDIGSLTPNMLTVSGTGSGSKSAPQFSIRGQSQQERGGLADQSVNVYFGDVVMERTQGLNQNLFDIRDIEVIRGPVGTLFGKNSTGGAVIIRPNLPTTDRVEGGVDMTVAQFDTINADAYINIPVSDSVAFRFGGASANDKGYIYDERLGRNVNNTATAAARGQMLLQSGSLKNITLVDYFRENDGGSGGFARFLNPNGLVATLGPLLNYPSEADMLAEQKARGNYRIDNGVPEFNKVDTGDIQNTTTLDLGGVTLKNIFGWRHVNSHILIDLDGTEAPLLHTEIFDHSRQISNEFQVFGDTDKLQWIAGAYYFNERGSNNASSIILGRESGGIESSTTFVPGATDNWQKFDNTSYALFAQGTYKVLDGVSLTLGGRYTWDKRGATILNRVIDTKCGFTIDDDGNPATPEINPGDGPRCRVDASADFQAFTYNAVLNYKPDSSTLLYASLRRGYRSGGFAARATTQLGLSTPYKPEFVRSVELGLKRDWHFGGAFLQTNLALYHTKYTNVQRQVVDTTSANPFSVMVNAAEATIQGIELETTFRPVDRLTLSGFWGYTDAHFDKFIDPFTGADLSGQKFARVPKNNWRLSGTLDLFRSQNLGDLSFTAAYSGRDSYLDADGGVIPYDIVPSHQQLDLYLKAGDIGNSDLELTLFAKNVTNNTDFKPLAGVYSSLGFAAFIPGPPRQIGIQLHYGFKGH